jgi:hypothetical protein
MAGRRKQTEAQAGNPPASSLENEGIKLASNFQSPKREPQQEGVKVESFLPKALPSDPGYVHPEMRMNKDYQEKLQADANKAKAEKMKKSMGYAESPTTVFPSPNSTPRVATMVW